MNPIGILQELCQKQRIALPSYEFEPILEGFHCTVQMMGLKGTSEGASKKVVKEGDAVGLLEVIGGS